MFGRFVLFLECTTLPEEIKTLKQNRADKNENRYETDDVTTHFLFFPKVSFSSNFSLDQVL